MLWFRRTSPNECLMCDDDDDNDEVVVDIADQPQENIEKGWLNGKRWIPAPHRAAQCLLLKQLQKSCNDGDVAETLRTTGSIVKRCYQVLPIKYLVQNNLTEFVLFIVQGSFSVVIAISPQQVREALLLDKFKDSCSTRLVPALNVAQIWIREHQLDVLSFAEEILPTLKLAAQNSVVLLKFVHSKTRPVVVYYVVPTLKSFTKNTETKALILGGVHVIRNSLVYIIQTGQICFHPEYLRFVVDNHVVIMRCFTKLIKLTTKALVRAVPAGYRFAHSASTTTVFALTEMMNSITTFLEKNPKLKELISEIFSDLRCFIMKCNIASDLIPAVLKILCNFSYKYVEFISPLLSSFLKDYGPVLCKFAAESAKSLWPVVRLALKSICSSETKNLIVSNLPWIISSVTAAYRIVEVSAKHSVIGSKYVCYELFEFSPVFTRAICGGSLLYCDAIRAIAGGFFSAFQETSPIVASAFCEAYPDVKSGACVVAHDVKLAIEVVSPTLWIAALEVMATLRNGLSEVYPELITAFNVVFPTLIKAAATVSPVVLCAQVELLRTLYEACCIVFPTLFRAMCTVTPTLLAAFAISAPVLASAGLIVGVATYSATSEIMKTSSTSLKKAITTSFNGATVVTKDLGNACYLVSESSKEIQLINADARFFISTVYAEFSSFMWMMFCLDISEKERPKTDINWENRAVLSTVRQTSNQIAALTLRTVILGKLCLSRSSSIASSTMYEINIRISNCYEKMEPYVLEFALKSQTCLNAMFRFSDEMESKALAGVYNWYQTSDILQKISFTLPSVSHMLELVTHDICLWLFNVISKLSYETWIITRATCPIFWNALKKASPEIWQLVCDASPPLWLNICNGSRKLWDMVLYTSPRFWNATCLYSSAIWNNTCIVVPEIWTFIKKVSPDIWSSTCSLLSKSWNSLCHNSERAWDMGVHHGPSLWQNACEIIWAFWNHYCYLGSTTWDLFCFAATSTWKLQRGAAGGLWNSTMTNISTWNATASEANLFFATLLKCCGNVWFSFCLLSAFFAILRQHKSVSDLIFSEKLDDVTILDCTNSAIPTGKDYEANVSTPTRALLLVIRDISSMRSFLTSAKTTASSYIENTTVRTVTSCFHSTRSRFAPRNVLKNQLLIMYSSLLSRIRSLLTFSVF